MLSARLLIILFLFLIPDNCFSESNIELNKGEFLRSVKMLGINVKDRQLSSYQGKPLIINVWASWCGPCRAEMQSLEKLKLSDINNDFSLIGISTDDYHDKAIALVNQAGLTFDNFRDTNLVLEKMLGANRIPLTVFIDRNGRIIKKIRGSMNWGHPNMIKMVYDILKLDNHVEKR